MISAMEISFIAQVKSIFGNTFDPLHRPKFEDNERQYLIVFSHTPTQ